MRSSGDDVQDDEERGPPVWGGIGLPSPRTSTLIIGGLAAGGIVCMCLAVALLAALSAA